MHEKPYSIGPDGIKIRFPLSLDDLPDILAVLHEHGYRTRFTRGDDGSLQLEYERETVSAQTGGFNGSAQG